MPDFWLYVPEVDEAGCVASGDSPREALRNATEIGWLPDPGAEIIVYELGSMSSLYMCDCAGCGTCGSHCLSDCVSGEGEECEAADD